MDRKPNILWLCTDQQRNDSLGCYGNELIATPNIDRLASEGTTFDAAFCQCPVCTPSRASFLTGRYPRTCNVRQNGVDIPDTEVPVTRLLAEAGYACGLSGKLHLSAANASTGRISERRINDGYGVFRWSHHPYRQWGSPGNQYQLDLRARGIDYVREKHPRSKFVQTSMPSELSQTAWCADQAMAFMEESAHYEQPWLFSVNFFDPHHPFDPPPELMEKWIDRLDEVPLPDWREGELDDKPVYQRIDAGIEPERKKGKYAREKMTDDDHRMVRAAYWAMVECIDHHVGRMMAKLRELGQDDNTLVIFMSDHGEMLGDHGLYEKGPYLYDALMRVPLILRQPGAVPAGRRSDALVELVDLAPTLLEHAGQPVPEAMQGRSLLPLLQGERNDSDHRDDVYGEYYNTMVKHADPKAYLTMLRTHEHKLVVDHTHYGGELYDLRADPGESHNLWDDAGAQTVKMQLMQRLIDRMAFTADPLPPRISQW